MQVTYVELENYRTHKFLALDLESGLNSIVGPNGVGKSSVLEAIGICLFDSEHNMQGIVGPFSETFSVYVKFIVNGVEYTAERSYPNSDFRINDIVCSKNEYVKQLEEIFDVSNLPYIYNNVVCTKQFDIMRLLSSTPSEQNRLLTNLFGLDKYDDYLSRQKAFLREISGELNALETNSLEQKIQEAIDSNRAIEEKKLELERKRRELSEYDEKDYETLFENIQRIEGLKYEYKQVVLSISNIKKQIAACDVDKEYIDSLEREYEEHRDRIELYTDRVPPDLRVFYETARQEGVCPICGNEELDLVDPPNFDLESYRLAWSEYSEKSRLETELNKLEKEEVELNAALQGTDVSPKEVLKVTKLKTEIDNLQYFIDSIGIIDVAGLETKLKNVQNRIELLEYSKKVAEEVARVAKEVPPRMVSKIKRDIQADINRLLSNWKVPLSTSWGDEFNVNNRLFKNTSGGEKVIVSLAFRIVLGWYVNAPSILVLDEPLDSLDKNRRNIVIDMLNDLECEQVIMVTHYPIEVGNVIELGEDNNGSDESIDNDQ